MRITTYHGSHTPNIRASTPLGTQNDLGRPILSGLDVVCEVVVHPARVSEICNLDTDNVKLHVVHVALVATRGCGGCRCLV